jgi:hypothetical protein
MVVRGRSFSVQTTCDNRQSPLSLDYFGNPGRQVMQEGMVGQINTDIVLEGPSDRIVHYAVYPCLPFFDEDPFRV